MSNPAPMAADELVSLYNLAPHPEGGFYKRSYASPVVIALPNGKSRPSCTAVLFLLAAGQKSHLHRLVSDELWHFYMGGPLEICMLLPTGELQQVILGSDVRAGQSLQVVVPAGCWFGARLLSPSFCFFSCSVSPGFDFEDFELATPEICAELVVAFPHAADMIRSLALPPAAKLE